MTGRHLSLLSQLDYTDGLCAPFALAARDLLGGEIRLLHATDPRQLRQHDWPAGMLLCLHAFLQLEDGSVVDAEGRRDFEEMRRSFGIRRGWSFQVEGDPDGSRIAREFSRSLTEDKLDAARSIMLEHGWEKGAPAANGELAARFKEARLMQRERAAREMKFFGSAMQGITSERSQPEI